MGVKGNKGTTGTDGNKGEMGEKGTKGEGSKGDKGDRGGKGNQGPKGLRGFDGPPGVYGDKGDKGANGTTGFPGTPSPHFAVTVRHSQSLNASSCPQGFDELYTGYSFVFLYSYTFSGGVDLGGTGSCLARFDPLPFVSCTLEICDSDDRTGYSYWLGNQNTQKSSDPKQLVSRCTVCKGRASLLTMHSQTTSVPDCPDTYASLWEGYSYVMNRGKDLGGTFQDLSSSGSCLERYKGLPFIECNQNGKCARYSTANRGYWLAALDHPERPRTMSTSAARGEDRVSRCRVCATFL